jgi:hypothetical protein
MIVEGIGRTVIIRGPFNLLYGADSIKFSIQNAEWRGIQIILCIILSLYFSVHCATANSKQKVLKCSSLHTLGYSYHFNKINGECNLCLHKFSKSLLRSTSAVPGKGLNDVFSFQTSPRAT